MYDEIPNLETQKQQIDDQVITLYLDLSPAERERLPAYQFVAPRNDPTIAGRPRKLYPLSYAQRRVLEALIDEGRPKTITDEGLADHLLDIAKYILSIQQHPDWYALDVDVFTMDDLFALIAALASRCRDDTDMPALQSLNSLLRLMSINSVIDERFI